MRRRALLKTYSGIGLLAALSCSGLPLHLETRSPPSNVFQLIAVYPVALRYEAPVYRGYELAMDEVGVVLARGKLSALGPSEFKVLDARSDDFLASTTVVGRLAALRLQPGDALALRGWVERREQNGTQQITDAQGRATGKRDVAITLVVHEELLGPSTASPLAEGWVEVPVDPFADHPPYDDTPELRRAVRQLTDELLGRVEPQLHTGTPVRDPGFDYLLNPRDEEDFSDGRQPPLRQQWTALDPISLDSMRLLRALYFAPDRSEKELMPLLQLPGGLLVESVHSDRMASAGLRKGDLIVLAEEDPVVGPQTLLRWLSHRSPGTPTHVVVRRAGVETALELPSPER